jgi:lipopolysaccharide heptosyltransferase II
MKNWKQVKHILCIRPDNMGDVLMTQPALKALKETYGAQITMLTSSMGEEITRYMPEIDDTLVYDLPWVKKPLTKHSETIDSVVEQLKKSAFDGAIIFTAFSQNPIPSIMLAYMAHIPLRLAYCRENTYELLTHWVADKEPFDGIKHGVERNLDLVKAIGATTQNTALSLTYNKTKEKKAMQILQKEGVSLEKPWLLLHPGVSEEKRQYPPARFVEAAKQIRNTLDYQIILTGNKKESLLTKHMQKEIGKYAFSVSGKMDLETFIALIASSPLLISNNTGPVHIAAAVQTPVVDVYARTNPEHTPWEVPSHVLYFDVPMHLQSKNTILEYASAKDIIALPKPQDILHAASDLLGIKKKLNNNQGFYQCRVCIR